MRSSICAFAVSSLAFTLTPAALGLDVPASPAAPVDRAAPAVAAGDDAGIKVSLVVEPLDDAAGPLVEGRDVRVRFTIADTAAGTPISGLAPAAWMDRLPRNRAPGSEDCGEKVASFLGGSLFAQAELNLNVYYVLALNDDATITVVDPLFGFGSTKLLALVLLESPGEDWAFDDRRHRLYVSMPEVGKIAVISTDDWTVLANVSTGGRPARLAMEADGRFLWVADDGLPAKDGSFGDTAVSLVDTAKLEVAARIPLPPGYHDMVLGAGDRRLFVTSRAAGMVSVIDTPGRKLLAEIPVGGEPYSVAWSELGGAAFVADTATGAIVAIDGETAAVAGRMQAAPGLGRLRFAPGGRWGFVPNALDNRVSVIDAASRRIVQSGEVEPGPIEISFTANLAYVRHRDSELVFMIPLDQVGQEGAPLSVVDFPGGEAAPSQGVPPSRADLVVPAPGGPSVLVGNPADRMIYFYKEGMAAPMGSFKNYGHQPRAVGVVDRSLRETGPGVYETTARLGRAGRYDVAFFMPTPQVMHCFGLEVAADPALADVGELPVKIVSLAREKKVTVGEPVALRFRFTDRLNGEPRTDVEDLKIITFLGPGQWQQRDQAKHEGDGVYATSFTPPEKGIYYVFLRAPSLGLDVARASYLVLEAREGEAQ